MGHLLKALSKKNPIIQDGFNRADSAVTMGNANTGQTWTVGTNLWGISSNAAYSVSPSTLNYVTIPCVSDMILSTKIIFALNEGIVFRYTDANNHIFCRLNASTLVLVKVVATVQTTLFTYSIVPVVGNSYTIKVICIGSSIRCFLNGLEVITVTETFNQTATRAGLRSGGTTEGRYDNFLVESL